MKPTVFILFVIFICNFSSCLNFKSATYCNYDSKSNSSYVYQFNPDSSVCVFLKSEKTNRIKFKGRWNLINKKVVCLLDETYNYNSEKVNSPIDTIYVNSIPFTRSRIKLKKYENGLVIKNRLVLCPSNTSIDKKFTKTL